LAGLGVALAATVGLSVAAEGSKKVPAALDFTMTSIDGKPVELSQYAGKVVLFVNVASRCGYTKQYTGLQATYEKYKDKGLVVIGVPANEFGSQEPGSNEEIQKFCTDKYKVTFPMLGKVVVKGEGIAPLYKYLTTNSKPAGDIGWNFEKFLIGRDGAIVGRYKSSVAPEGDELTKAIEGALAAK
jgi:glutathione peroxidase